MTSFITQCPQCRTSFRVSRTQLIAAHGVVRCGACMELFNAARHLQEDERSAGATTTSAAIGRTDPVQAVAAPPPAKPASKDETRWIHDELDLDNLDLDEELAKLERQELELSNESLELQPSSAGGASTAAQNRSRIDDEAWAERLLATESDTPATDRPVQAEAAAAGAPTSGTADLHFTPVSAEHPAPPSPLKGARGVLAEPLDADGRIEPVFDGVVETDDAPLHADLPADNAEREPTTDLAASRDGNNPLFELDDEPLQLDWQARRRPWARWFGWGLLNLIALLVLVAQYVTYNFDELARQDSYRPWLERVCPTFGCELPPRVDISQIKSSNLVVRSHPDVAGALVVDAIIYNRASFAQPFPLLEIRFDDINGKMLARRTFKPGEYLSGELAGQREMPSQIPIHIALDILDPGAKAVNYSLSFRSPE